MKYLIVSEVILATSLFGYILFKIKKHFGGVKCTCPNRLDDTTIVITGANSGIGKELAFELAKRGANLVLACRNLPEANKVARDIENQTKVIVKVRYLDLTSLSTVKEFSEELHQEYHNIYALVNNAAIFYNEAEQTIDKYDKTIQVNYLGPVYLTHLLLDLLKNSVKAKIINIGSQAHVSVGSVQDVQDIFDGIGSYDRFKAYGVSKLALAAFTFNLAEKLKGNSVKVYSADPGNCETKIFRDFPPLSNPIAFALQKPIRYFVIRTPLQGAQTPLHILLNDSIKTGSYLYNCRPIDCAPLVKQITLNAFLMHINNSLQNRTF